MVSRSIRLTLGDWLWNAAITGFVNIIGDDKQIKGESVEFSTNFLKDFEEKYFTYFINTYEKTLSWYKLISFKKIIENYHDNHFETFDLSGLIKANEYIKEAKRLLSSSSYKAAFELIGIQKGIDEHEKKLKKIKEPKTQPEFIKEKDAIIAEINQQFTIIDEIINYCSSHKGRKYIAAKNVIYTIIRNGWDGVSFLYRQTKEKDMYKDYYNYFVKEAVEYLEVDKDKFKYHCFNCGEPIKDLNNDLSFINKVGFDVARKPSHVWNFINDIAVCPLCKLVYSCLPAGFVYINNSGLYINANIDMDYNLRVNSNVKQSVLQGTEDILSSRKVYHALIEALQKQEMEKGKFELADIQVVRYRNGTYRFNILPQSTIKLIRQFHKEINRLFRTGYREGNDRYSIYEQVVELVINNQNLFTLLYKLLHHKLSFPSDCYFSVLNVLDILKINIQLIKNLGGMQDMDDNRDFLKEAKGAGYYLRLEYHNKDSNKKSNKISGISYRLLNALKTGNRNMFMDTLLNCYLYVGKEVPSVFLDVFKDDDQFRTIGYAFITGFIDDKNSIINQTENREEIVK